MDRDCSICDTLRCGDDFKYSSRPFYSVSRAFMRLHVTSFKDSIVTFMCPKKFVTIKSYVPSLNEKYLGEQNMKGSKSSSDTTSLDRWPSINSVEVSESDNESSNSISVSNINCVSSANPLSRKYDEDTRT